MTGSDKALYIDNMKAFYDINPDLHKTPAETDSTKDGATPKFFINAARLNVLNVNFKVLLALFQFTFNYNSYSCYIMCGSVSVFQALAIQNTHIVITFAFNRA